MKIFKNAKVGDSVYSLYYGKGYIHSIGEYSDDYPLKVRFGESCGLLYSLEGKTKSNQEIPDLYWEKPIILHARIK